MNSKFVDFAPVREVGKADQPTNTNSAKYRIRWSANRWLFVVLVGLGLACLAFAAIVWSILLSPIT